MTDEEAPGDGVEALCEFWEWALATKRKLEERVAEWSDSHRPRWESIEQDIVAMAEAQCESAKAITENRREFRKFWRAESERELRIAKDELQRFPDGPVGRIAQRPPFTEGSPCYEEAQAAIDCIVGGG